MGSAENLVLKQIMDYVKYNIYVAEFPHIDNIKLFRTNNIAVKGRTSLLPKGYPDTSGFIKLTKETRPTPFYCEMKTAKGLVSREQTEFFQSIVEDGCYGLIARSLDDFKTFLGNLC